MFQFPTVIQHLPALLSGLWTTILLVLVSLFAGVLVGLSICVGLLVGRWPIPWISKTYVALFRGLPETVIIFWLYYCGPLILNVKLSAFNTGVVALAIPTGAYLAEIFRAGILAVPRGQIEAARALGLSDLSTTWDIITPQALQTMIPPILGIIAILIKNSALVSAIGVGELFYQATILSGQTFRYLEFLSASAVIYIALILPLSILLQSKEKQLQERFR